VDAAAEGINAVGGVSVRLRERPEAGDPDQGPELDDGSLAESPSTPASSRRVALHTASGFGVHTDIIVATAEAYVAAVNGLIRARSRATNRAVA